MHGSQRRRVFQLLYLTLNSKTTKDNMRSSSGCMLKYLYFIISCNWLKNNNCNDEKFHETLSYHLFFCNYIVAEFFSQEALSLFRNLEIVTKNYTGEAISRHGVKGGRFIDRMYTCNLGLEKISGISIVNKTGIHSDHELIISKIDQGTDKFEISKEREERIDFQRIMKIPVYIKPNDTIKELISSYMCNFTILYMRRPKILKKDSRKGYQQYFVHFRSWKRMLLVVHQKP